MKPRTLLPTIAYDLPGHLFDLLENELNNIKYVEIDTPEKRDEKLKQIQQKLVWNEVEISEVKILDHRTEKVKVKQSWENPYPMGEEEEIYIVTVEAETTGSPELFGYSPVAVSFTSSMDQNVYEPINNKITLEVRSKKFDKLTVLNEANKTLTLTKSFIESNNKWISDYNKTFVNTIEERFNKKADEITKFYS
ncbi:hypothetical protein [Chryseobacterium gregarium]|uniref:hypothetical protein n=1 Tax=Chryseobacterium gregarium TaxID=456299 RepID=UPI000409C11D|nr:hypothetical protein [Chryseobacterium gregarium]